ncbi:MULTISPECIES: hypothetical protein [unclassified Streptomyces]|uniref:hypothetical protein n=1 Tax=unclassified Streptomyces TaxID=2593676 RepID=UPI0006AF732F|nr:MULTISPECIES: hypothetical protein [unclassified Streptomyces]KOX19849.1 hypothetical protein ADL06_28370 [Streptomyces sp. NRRL F-6491]KOX37934.1 hypothetical protein ADL08_27980 [Streptomyces sp. NRRL F-6492]
MTALLVLFGVIIGAGALAFTVVHRRGGGRADPVEGLLQEEEALRRARTDRVSFNSWSVHNYLPTSSDAYHRRSDNRH